jgi:hypothetical protein
MAPSDPRDPPEANPGPAPEVTPARGATLAPWGLRRRVLVAAICGVIFVSHTINHARRGDAWEIFWACTWVPLMVGAAALTGSARLNAVGLVWLALGNLLWLFDLLAGGAWMWTSTLTHWGALALGLWAARWLGYPRGSWWRAHLLLLGWQQLTRLFTPPGRNINVAFSIHPASRDHFSSFAVYWITLFFLDALIMYAGERLYRRLLPAPPAA